MPDSPQNPYLALLQQEEKPPGWAQILQHIGNLGFGLAGGFGQAATTGQPTMAGIGPGLMMGNQLNAQAAHQAEQERMKRLEWQFKAQEHEDKRAEVLRKEDQLKAYLNMPGFQVAPQQGPLMGPTPGGTTTQPGPDLKTAGAPLVDYLVAQHGFSPLAASTIVGNLYQESGFNPAATGDSGSAFGMAQWRLDRQTGLRNFAASQPGGPKPVTDPQVQIDYLVSEMKGGDMGAQRAYAMLQQAKTPEQANAAIMHFFRPAGYTPANPAGGHGFQNRVQYTQALLPQSRPGDPATAPVPGMGPDPNEPPASAPGPAPRPGLGPRAAPPSGPAPDGVPVAQGGGEGEVVLPRIGLPFPARPPAPAPPGSVPFPTGAVPGAPGAVPVQYTPQPGQPSMAPGGAPAPGGANPPPEFVPPARVPVPPEVARHFKGLAAAGLITVGQAEKSIEDYGENLNKQVHETARAQYTARVEIWKQREQVAVEQRKIQAQVEAERRAIAEAKRKHEESRDQKGEWIRQGGVLTFVPEKDIKPGMTKEDTPKEPPAPGTPAGDDHILSTADPGSVEYRDAYARQQRTPHVINGQAYVRDMTKVPPPTYGQPAGAPAPSAAPTTAPASKPSDIPGQIPVGEKNYTQEQSREHKFALQIDNAFPKILALVTDENGNYTSKNLPSSVDIGLALNSYVPDAIVGNKARRYRQYVKDIITATLRDTSGATIGSREFTDDMQKYIPMAGDDAQTIKDKLDALKVFAGGMAAGTGRPIDQYPTVKSFSEPITIDKSGRRQ